MQPFFTSFFKVFLGVVVGVCSFAVLSCGDDNELDEENSVLIGVLIPFTGKDAPVGNAYEHAALMVQEKINKNGGIAGKPLEFVVRDTNSDSQRAVESLNEILTHNVYAVVGVESSEASRKVLPLLAENGIPFVSPVISGASTIELPQDYPWYRLAPSSAVIARSFANFLVTDLHVLEMSTVYSGDDYNSEFVAAFVSRFSELGGSVSTTVHLAEGSQSYSEEIDVLRKGTTNILIASATNASARLINEISLTNGDQGWQWFFAPSVEMPSLLINTFTAVLEGAVGVSVDVYNESQDFISQYRAKWDDDPIEGVFYYYDAISLLALSIEKAAQGHHTRAEIQSALKQNIMDMASPVGIQVHWDTLPKGLGYIQNGNRIHFSGLTGPLSLDDTGQQQRATVKFWQISHGVITDIEGL